MLSTSLASASGRGAGMGDRSEPHYHNNHDSSQHSHHHHHQHHPQHHHQHQGDHGHRHHQHHQHHHHQHQQQEQQHSEQHQHRRTVLIAMDGSPHSLYAFDWYMAHFHKPDTEVIVAHSSSHNNASFPPVHTLMTSAGDSTMSRSAQHEEEEVNKIATQIRGKLTQSGVRGRLLRLVGDAGATVVQAAQDHNATCIVTGCRGLGTVKRALVGSVSDYILHHAHCPVLVCRHKEVKESGSKDKDK